MARARNLHLHDTALRVIEDFCMDRDQLRAMQAPVKQRYLTNSASALVSLRAEGTLGRTLLNGSKMTMSL